VRPNELRNPTRVSLVTRQRVLARAVFVGPSWGGARHDSFSVVLSMPLPRPGYGATRGAHRERCREPAALHFGRAR
jgi:hypothetical protein